MSVAGPMPRLASIMTLVVLTLITALPVWAQQPDPPLLRQDTAVTVETLIDMAATNRSAYRRVLEGEEIIPELRLGAVGQFLPRVSAGASYSNSDSEQEAAYLEGTPIPGTGGTFLSSSSSWYVNANQTLFDGLSRVYDYRKAQLQVESTLLGTERAHDQLVSDVKSTAYAFIASQRALDVELEILEQRQEALRLASTRFETGDAIEIEVMQAEIDVNAQENAVLSARQSVENAREQLNLAVGLNLESRFPVAGDLDPMMPDVNADSLISIALRARPDLTQQRNTVQSNEYDVDRFLSEYIPSASAFLTYSRSETVSNDRFAWEPLPGDRNVRYGLSLDWTLFDGFSREVRRENAVVAKRQSMWDLHQAEQNVAQQVRQQWRTLTALFEQIGVADRNRELARRQLELEQERYRVGVSDQLNLRSAQVTFVSAEREYLSRVLDYFTTMAALERDLGVPLEEVAR